MAQRVDVVLVDDLDGSQATATVRFGLDGTDYEIDLSANNAKKLRAFLDEYVERARRTGGRRRTGARGAASARESSGPPAAEIRAWARENGWDVPDRGRVAAEVREAFMAEQSTA